MMILLRNVNIYSPAHIGKRDLLIANGVIEKISEKIFFESDFLDVIECGGAVAVPGYIDGHVHLTGGGGENSFRSRVPEIQFSEFVCSGITTAVGLLGTDVLTRDLHGLLAKTRALKEEGLTAFMLTGGYRYPSPTLTDSVDRDIALLPEVLGVKVAMSDHRASYLDEKDLIRLGSQARVSSMISGKAGVVTIHVGDGKAGLRPLREAVRLSDVPAKHFIPTHINRSEALCEEGLQYLKDGGRIDLTSGMGIGTDLECWKVLSKAVADGLATDRITMSSDGNGSWSAYDDCGNITRFGVSSLATLHDQVRCMVTDGGLSLSQALAFVTANPAEYLGLSSRKGCIQEGADADILLLSDELDITDVFMGGKQFMKNGQILMKGTFE